MKNKFINWFTTVIILLFVLLAAGIAAFYAGSTDISFAEIIKALVSDSESIEREIILNLRLPRVLLAIAVGGALSISGVLLQGIFRNPLVEPYTLGISGGAGVGVCLCLIFKAAQYFGVFVYPLCGFIGAILALAAVYSLSIKKGLLKIDGMLLTGVMVSFISSSVIMLIMSAARTEELHGIIYWTMGSLDQPNRLFIIITLAISLIGLGVSYIFCKPLNAFALGEKEAFHLGVNTETSKKYIFLTASILTGLCVSVAGIIGFIGLVVPHFVRMITGRDHRILLIGSYICGAVFLILCDMIARTVIKPIELPVGVLTGLIGGALFIITLNINRSRD